MLTKYGLIRREVVAQSGTCSPLDYSICVTDEAVARHQSPCEYYSSKVVTLAKSRGTSIHYEVVPVVSSDDGKL